MLKLELLNFSTSEKQKNGPTWRECIFSWKIVYQYLNKTLLINY